MIITPPIYYGKLEEDPAKWLRDFNNAAIANNWYDTRKLEIVVNYLKGNAAYWFEEK